MPPFLKRALRIFLNILIGVFFIYGLAVASGAIVGYLIAQKTESAPHHEDMASKNESSAEHITAPMALEHHEQPETPIIPDRTPTAQPMADPDSHSAGWRKNAIILPPYAYRDKKLVAIIIDDAGMNTKRTKELIEIKAPLVMSFLPYAPHVDSQVKSARASGHEILVHVPMEPVDVDAHPGPDALMMDMEESEVIENLQKNLQRFDSYIGINNHMGSKFTADSARMRLVLQEIKKRDLIFVDSMTSAQSVAGKIAAQMGIMSAKRDVFLDDEDDAEKIKEQFNRLNIVAGKHGTAIAIGHPRPKTIAALKEWLVSIEGSDTMVVPLSVVLLEQGKAKNKNHE